MGRLFSVLSFVVEVLCFSSIANGFQLSSGFNVTDEFISVTEGDNLTVVCNRTGSQISWNIPNGPQVFGRQLTLTNITREMNGIYFCSSFNSNKIVPEEDEAETSPVYTNTFYLDVLYPTKIRFVNINKNILQPDETLDVHFGIEGNPAPRTTFMSISDGKLWFNQTTSEEGNYTISIKKVNCTDAGAYKLACENKLGTDSRKYEIYVACVPDPVTDIHVNGITTSEATIGFTTGNGYNTTQFFYIMRVLDGQLKDFQSNTTDTPNDGGGKPFFVTIRQLSQITSYNVTVISGNRWGNSTLPSDFVSFETFGKPEPDPNFIVNKTFTPRLGESVSLIIHARGNPLPNYQWSHTGKSINSTNANYTSVVDVKNIIVDDFGTYKLTMSNGYGFYSTDYDLLADGPPDPVTNLFVFNINFTCAHVNFTTGYNYNSTQTFLIKENMKGKFRELMTCKDLTTGRGGDPFTCELCSLSNDTLYNITVVANNSRGESEHNPESVTFSTYGKPKLDPNHPSDTTFKPRLGRTVTLSIQVISHPPPKFLWMHNDKNISSKDTNTSSSIDLKNIEVKDFGKYILNVSNEAGSLIRTFEILAEGPPEPVTNLTISTVTVSSANLNFLTGYDYNKTQTFVVMRYLNGNTIEMTIANDTQSDPGQKKFNISVTNLTMNTEYNVTVVARNINGTAQPSEKFVPFMTEGIPEPDPAIPENKTRTPRLGETIMFHVHAVGNPPPTFLWWHNNIRVDHKDEGQNTTLEITNVTEHDFGDYILNMQNTVGSKNYTFAVKAEGPPGTVTNLTYTDVAADYVELRWNAGYDYGSLQTFQIQGSVNNKPLLNVKEIADTTGGKGGRIQFKLNNLESSSQYVVSLVAKNARGEAPKSNEISFTTKADGTTTAEYVGYIVGGIGAVVFIIAVIYVARRFYKRRSEETPYQPLNEEESRPQPHRYRYDDAANPRNI